MDIENIMDEFLNHDLDDELVAMAKEFSCKGKPCFELKEMLMSRNMSQLKTIAHMRGMDGYKSLKKSGLIKRIADDILVDISDFQDDLLDLESIEFKFFSMAANSKIFNVKSLPFLLYETLVVLGYVGLYMTGEGICLVVPNELKSWFRKLVKKGLNEYKTYTDLCHDTARSCANLYGFITVDDYIKLLKRVLDIDYKKDIIKDILGMTQYRDGGEVYEIHGEYVLSFEFLDMDEECIEQTMLQADEKPRYFPKTEDFLKHVFFDYLGEKSGLEPISGFLSKYVQGDRLDFVLGGLRMLFAMQKKQEHMLDILEECDISLRPAAKRKFIKLVKEARDDVRLWSNKGFSNKELEVLHRPNVSLFQPL